MQRQTPAIGVALSLLDQAALAPSRRAPCWTAIRSIVDLAELRAFIDREAPREPAWSELWAMRLSEVRALTEGRKP